MYKKIILLVVIISAANFSLRSQTHGNLYEPTREEMLLRYKKAARLDSAVRTSVYYQSVQPVWLEKGNSFWYQRIHPDSTMEYLEVNPEKGVKQLAFNHSRLAASLSAVTKKTIPANRLQISINRIDSEKKMMEFSHEGKRWMLDLASFVIQPVSNNNRNIRWNTAGNGWTKRSRWMNFSTDAVSPDKKWRAEVVKHNLSIVSLTGGAEIQLTTDGTAYATYGSIAWSPDGSYLIFYRILPYEDSVIHYLNMARDENTRGSHYSLPYKQPGDPFTSYEMMVYKIGEKQPRKINIPVIDFFGAPYLHFSKTQPGKFLFERVDRGHQRFRILEADISTGETRTVYDEQTKSFIYESRIFTDYLSETNEIILSSEKDGWRHLYLLDIKSGKIKNQISSGNWIVKEIDSIDYKKREIWFRGAGMKEFENPYYVHHYRIGFDGNNLVELNPEPGHHLVNYSPDGKYFLDSYSEVNIAPVITIRSSKTGKMLLTVERPDTSRILALQVPTPFPFKAKGRDGKTDIWGVVCWPVDMDSTKQYPVIEHIYAGPQDAFVPKSYLPYSEMQSMAALGFIVVQIDGMGTANRSKAFHDVCWKNLADGGFPDRISWIKSLAETYPWVDTTRVGIYGTSAGGQNALGGLLFHPSFYKAAVSACGCHDNRIDKQWWNEQWMGYPVGQHYAAQSNITHANKLRGSLLLIVGDEDSNVPPESTYRVADALIKSGKHFELLSIPGMGHSDGGSYGRIRKRDFFVKSLFRMLPPDRNTQ
jgi:dipeptidyl aminopeptidase/acylaminoacyl peptidase